MCCTAWVNPVARKHSAEDRTSASGWGVARACEFPFLGAMALVPMVALFSGVLGTWQRPPSACVNTAKG